MCEQYSNNTVVCIGSNTPDRLSKLQEAFDSLRSIFTIVAVSPVYESPDDSGLGDEYVNMVIECDTRGFDYETMRDEFKRLEYRLGRNDRSKSSGVMPIDLDIIIWNGDIVDRYQYSREYFQTG